MPEGVLINDVLIPASLMLGMFGIFLVGLKLSKGRMKKGDSIADFEPESHRTPGQSLQEKINIIKNDLHICTIAVIILPILIVITHFSYTYFSSSAESLVRTIVSAGGGLSLEGYFLCRLCGLISKRRQYQIAYEDVVITARELSQLNSQGYFVYHDVPEGSQQIDHLLIGTAGVMVVATKTLAKSAGNNRRTDAVVTYDGRMLHFPKYSDYKIIESVEQQADRLSRWLSETIEEDICARAILALPGWSVKRTSADGIPVVNPKQFNTLFKHIKPRPLTESAVEKIVAEIEQHCREADSCYNKRLNS